MAEQHQLVDLWRQVIATAPQNLLDSVSEFNWNFSNLEEAFEEDGMLHGKKVYLFCCKELQYLPFRGQHRLACIPVVVAIVSSFPPSDKIGISSVESGDEILDMTEMNMDWVPWGERLESQIFILSHVQEGAELDQEKLKNCLPYFYNPLKEVDIDKNPIVDIMYPFEPNPIVCEFDWELDELEEFTNELIASKELFNEHKDAFKEFVREKVREGKRAYLEEARENRNRALEELSQEEVDTFKNMRFYKFYPVASIDTPDISRVKSLFINKYYGKAHQIL